MDISCAGRRLDRCLISYNNSYKKIVQFFIPCTGKIETGIRRILQWRILQWLTALVFIFGSGPGIAQNLSLGLSIEGPDTILEQLGAQPVFTIVDTEVTTSIGSVPPFPVLWEITIEPNLTDSLSTGPFLNPSLFGVPPAVSQIGAATGGGVADHGFALEVILSDFALLAPVVSGSVIISYNYRYGPQPFSIPIINDEIHELFREEALLITVRELRADGTSTNRFAQKVVTIVDDDQPSGPTSKIQFATNPIDDTSAFRLETSSPVPVYSIKESDLDGLGNVVLNVEREGGPDGFEFDVEFGGSATNGGDYFTGFPLNPDIFGFRESTLPISSSQIQLRISDDEEIEPVEDIRITLVNKAGENYEVSDRDEIIIRIIDDDRFEPGVLSFADEGVTVIEGDIPGSVVVSADVVRTGGSDGELIASFETFDGSAMKSLDYIGKTGTLVFADGIATSQTIEIEIISDTFNEIPVLEDFSIQLFEDFAATKSLADTTSFSTVTTAALDQTNASEHLPSSSTGNLPIKPSRYGSQRLFRELIDEFTVLIEDDDQETGVLRFTESGTTVTEGDTPGTVFVSAKVERVGGTQGDLFAAYETSDRTAFNGQDYVGQSGTLVFTDGDDEAQILNIEIVSDTVAEFPLFEEFVIDLIDTEIAFKSNATSHNNPTSGSQYQTRSVQDGLDTFVVQVRDDDEVLDPGVLRFTDAGATVSEGNIPNSVIVQAKVERIGGVDGPISIDYVTHDGSANANTDYLATSGTLFFADGDDEAQIIDILIVSDTLEENPAVENFFLDIGQAEELAEKRLFASPITNRILPSGFISVDTFEVTISDDDIVLNPGSLEFVVDTESFVEGTDSDSRVVTTQIRRVGGSDGELSISYQTRDNTALVNADYISASGSIVFTDEDVEPKTIEFKIVQDNLFESPATESLFIDLLDLSLATPVTVDTVEIVITDDDVEAPVPVPGILQFVDNELTIAEGSTPGTVSVSALVQRVGGSDGLLSVDFRTIDGSAADGLDYLGRTGTLEFTDGMVGPLPITIDIVSDTQFETPGAESFSIELLDTSGQSPVVTDSITVQITDDDAEPVAGVLQLAGTGLSVAEGNLPGTVSVTAEIVRVGGTDGSLSIDFGTLDGSALAGNDYIASSGTITFADGQAGSQSVTLEIISDTVFEVPPTESFSLQLLDVSGAEPVVTASLDVIITDDDVEPLPGTLQFAVAGQSVAEGNVPDTVVVTALVQRLGGSSGALSIGFRTIEGSADDGSDYISNTGTLTFTDGDIDTQSISVEIISDTLFETPGTENFVIELIDVSSGNPVVSDSFTVVITDDDPQPQAGSLAFVVDGSVVNEGNSPNSVNVTALVQRVGGTDGELSVDFRTVDGSAEAGTDYIGLNSTLTFADGEVGPKAIVVDIVSDDQVETPASESFVIELVDASSASPVVTDSFTVQITDDDIEPVAGMLQLGDSDLNVSEGNDPGTVTVSTSVVRIGGSDGPLSINFQTVNGSAVAGSDYESATGTIAFANGEAGSKPITINIVSDSVFEAPAAESFSLQLIDVSAGGPVVTAALNVIITDDDPEPLAGTLEFTETGQTLAEGDTAGSVNVTALVQRVGGNAGALNLNYRTVPSTAQAGSDFIASAGPISFAAGDTSPQSIVIPIVSDSSEENPLAEVFTIELFDNSTGVDVVIGIFTVQITDDDTAVAPAPVVQFTSSSVNTSIVEGADTVEVRLFLVSGSGPALVNVTTQNGSATADSDFVSQQLVALTIPAGQQVPITIPLVNDGNVESGENFSVVVTPADGSTTQIGAVGEVMIAIVDDDAEPVPQGNPGTVQFTSNVLAVNEDDETAVVSIQRTGSSDGLVTVVVDTDPGSALNNIDYGNTTQTLTWAAGEQSTQSVSIPILSDSENEGDEVFVVNLQQATPDDSVLGELQQVTVTISDVPLPTPEPAPQPAAQPVAASVLKFKQAEYTVREDEVSIVVEVIRDGGSEGEVTVEYNTVEGSATANLDYRSDSGTLTWADGDSTSRTIQIQVVPDDIGEGLEQFGLVLANAMSTGSVSIESPAVTTILLNNVNPPFDAGIPVAIDPEITPQVMEPANFIPEGQFQFSQASLRASESDGTVSLVVKRVGGAAGSVLVNYQTRLDVQDGSTSAIANQDFMASSGTLTWGDTDTSDRTLEISLLADTELETDETFVVELFGAAPIGDHKQLGNPARVTVTIAGETNQAGQQAQNGAGNSVANNAASGVGTIRFVSGTTDGVLEADGSVQIEVERVNGTEGNVSVSYRTQPDTALEGDDFTRTNGTLTWLPGEGGVKTLSVPLLSDSNTEQAESFFVDFISAFPVGNDVQLEGALRHTVNMAAEGGALNNLLASRERRLQNVDERQLEPSVDSVASNTVLIMNQFSRERAAQLASAVDSLTARQVSALSARFRAMRSGNRQRLDLSGLNINVYDQVIPGSVVNAAQDVVYDNLLGELSGDFRTSFFMSGTAGLGDASVDVDPSRGIQPGAQWQFSDLNFGMDYRVTDSMAIGGSFGLQKNQTALSVSVLELADEAQIENGNVAVFGTWFNHHIGYLDVLLTNSFSRFGTEATTPTRGLVDAGFESAETFKGADAQVNTLNLSFGRDFHIAGWRFGPSGNVAMRRTSLQNSTTYSALAGFGTGLGKPYTSRTVHTLENMDISLQAELTKAFTTRHTRIQPRLHVEYGHQSSSSRTTGSSLLNPEALDSLFDDGAQSDNEFYRIGVSTAFALPKGRSGRFEYEARSGRGAETRQAVNFSIGLQF